ncbi:MAG: hypothetical protein RLZZ584_3188 [Pseudomonadota bacterium]|jgi:hypothetical protein
MVAATYSGLGYVDDMVKPKPTLVSRGEFIDAHAALQRGGVIVVLDDAWDACVLDGVRLRWSFPPLVEYGLVAEFDNPAGFTHLRYYRITAVGRRFAADALAAWRARPLFECLVIRLLG